MDIKLSHNWLKEYLKTKADPQKIASSLALCGPSVERVHKLPKDTVYDIEVTTNRVDTASVMGIAREAAAILPQFGIKATFTPKVFALPKKAKETLPFSIKIDKKINKRVMAVVIDGVSPQKSPSWLSERLEVSGVRSLNLLVDITNYVMLETGHPTHVFDYDKITSHKFVFRLSQKGERATTFDGKTYILPGGDIVIDDGRGNIVDIPGIIGTKNSVVGEETKRIIFFIDNNDPSLMRKTSTSLNIRTLAVELNEKGVDPVLAQTALLLGIELYKTLGKGKIVSPLYDLYPQKYKEKTVNLTLSFLKKRLGIDISLSSVEKILTSLGFSVSYEKKGDNIKVVVPSSRDLDVSIPEDIVEEVARIFGYHNFPSTLMSGAIPQDRKEDSMFSFEMELKRFLKGTGAVEIYSYSLVSKEKAGEKAVKLINPLGPDTEYLRTTLFWTCLAAAKENKGATEPFHLFEMANVYKSHKEKSDCPLSEVLMLAGIFSDEGYSIRSAKGAVESILDSLNIKYNFNEIERTDSTNLLEIKTKKGERLGYFMEHKGYFYYEFGVKDLFSCKNSIPTFVPVPKYPAQIEDITLILPHKTKVGELIEAMEKTQNIQKIELKDIYEDAYTFRVWYQDREKTLTNVEVKKIREKLTGFLLNKFGARVKD